MSATTASNSRIDLSTCLNVQGATITNSTMDATTAQLLTADISSYKNCTIIGLTADSPPLVISGYCQNLTIESDGGHVIFAPGAVVENCNLSGQRLICEMGEGVKCNNLQAADSCFITFQCDKDVSIANANFSNAIFSHCDCNGENITFTNCNFEGAHINPSMKGATFIGCSINDNTRLVGADLDQCNITDLKYHSPEGMRYVRNTSELQHLGAEGGRDCAISQHAQILLSLASVSGGQSCDTPENQPYCAAIEPSRDHGRGGLS